MSTTLRTLGLPQADGSRLHPQRVYEFWIGHPEHLPGHSKTVLRIPEHSNRSAEGRPRHPEQAEWIQQLIEREGLALTPLWYAQWTIHDEASQQRLLELIRA